MERCPFKKKLNVLTLVGWLVIIILVACLLFWVAGLLASVVGKLILGAAATVGEVSFSFFFDLLGKIHLLKTPNAPAELVELEFKLGVPDKEKIDLESYAEPLEIQTD